MAWTDIAASQAVFYVGIFICFAIGFMTGFRP